MAFDDGQNASLAAWHTQAQRSNGARGIRSPEVRVRCVLDGQPPQWAAVAEEGDGGIECVQALRRDVHASGRLVHDPWPAWREGPGDPGKNVDRVAAVDQGRFRRDNIERSGQKLPLVVVLWPDRGLQPAPGIRVEHVDGLRSTPCTVAMSGSVSRSGIAAVP